MCEYRIAEEMMMEKYQPASGRLFSDLVLI